VDQRQDGEFTAFVVARTPALLRTAYALTGDQHAAEDLVQTAFAKAYARWRRIAYEPEPYVRRIIYHDFVSAWRSRRRRSEVTVAEPPDQPARLEFADDSALRMLLRHALDTLPPRQRAVIILRYLEDLSVAETAAVLGCREGTVVSQASRALAKLRQAVPHAEPPSHSSPRLNGATA
jgi:RNA polymerase sigma-70 factor (sigma-E family)